MSIIFIYTLIITILLIHIYIIKYEYKYKKIPNNLLLILLFLNLVYFFQNGITFFLFPTIIKLLLVILLLWILFFFKIWNPSYIKYIFISSLFFLWKWEMTFISNVYFIILLYIVLYFFYYYFKILFNLKKLKSHINALKLKTKWSFNNWLIKNKEYVILKILIIIFWFFTIFILTRLLRTYLQWELLNYFFIIKINNITINSIVLIFIWILTISWFMNKLYKKYIFNNYKYLIITIIITILFIIYEYIYDYIFISNYLHKILTFLIFLFIIIRIIVKMWKYLFFDNDSKIIDYKDLKPWDIIDKKLILTYLIWQKSLENEDIVNYIKNIKNPIDKENCDKIKNLIQKNNDFQEKQWKILPPNVIRIYNTFLFSPFIFWAFFLTYLIQKNMLVIIIFEIYKKIMWF